MFLCCYVVELGIAKKNETKKNKKVEVLPGIFATQVMVACAKVIVFFWLFCCFSLLLKNTIKIGFFDDFEMLIFSFVFFCLNCRVNNLATVGSITWPHFSKKLENVAKFLTLQFSRVFLLKLLFFCSKNLIFPAERIFLKKKNKTTKKQ